MNWVLSYLVTAHLSGPISSTVLFGILHAADATKTKNQDLCLRKVSYGGRDEDRIGDVEQFRLRRCLQNEKDRAKALEASMHQTAAGKDREIEHLRAQSRCSICMERRCDTTFICVREDRLHFVCGHLACAECADQWKSVKKECHVCRAQIYQCTKLYYSGES